MKARICPLCHSYLAYYGSKSISQNVIEVLYKCDECKRIEDKVKYAEYGGEYYELK